MFLKKNEPAPITEITRDLEDVVSKDKKVTQQPQDK